MLKASIIIPTYNKRSRLAMTKWALQRQTISTQLYEVIIVDDGSTDGTASDLKNIDMPNWRCFSHERHGRAYCRNFGAKQAYSPLLIFLDDDILVRPDFIMHHLAANPPDQPRVVHGALYDLPFLRLFENPQMGTLIRGDVRHGSQDYFSSMRLTIEMLENDFDGALALQRPRRNMLEKAIVEVLDGWDGPIGPWLACVGANLSIPRSILDQVGGFDEAFGLTWGCEDLELGYRLQRQGYLIMRAEPAVGYHLTHYRKAPFEEHRVSHAYFYAKHRDPAIKHLQAFLEGRLPTLKVYAAAVDEEARGMSPTS